MLENSALDGPSVKVDHVRASLARAEAAAVPRWDAFADLLRDHTVDLTPAEVPRFPDGRERLAATLAPCVHADGWHPLIGAGAGGRGFGPPARGAGVRWSALHRSLRRCRRPVVACRASPMNTVVLATS